MFFLKIPKGLALQKYLDRAPYSERGQGPARPRRLVGGSEAWAEGPWTDVATREGPGAGQRAFRAGTRCHKGRQKAKEAHDTGTTSSSGRASRGRLERLERATS